MATSMESGRNCLFLVKGSAEGPGAGLVRQDRRGSCGDAARPRAGHVSASPTLFTLCITPTRRVRRVSSEVGLHCIAMEDVPIQLGFIDRKHLHLGWGPTYRPDGDAGRHNADSRVFYAGKVASAAKTSVPRLRSEDECREGCTRNGLVPAGRWRCVRSVRLPSRMIRTPIHLAEVYDHLGVRHPRGDARRIIRSSASSANRWDRAQVSSAVLVGCNGIDGCRFTWVLPSGSEVVVDSGGAFHYWESARLLEGFSTPGGGGRHHRLCHAGRACL